MYSGTVNASNLQPKPRFADYVAETYPFCVKFTGDNVVAYNAVTGEDISPWFPFKWTADEIDSESFSDAHKQAEQACEAAKAVQVAERKERIETPPLVEWAFLVPMLRDDDRQPHSVEVWHDLHDALIERFGGFTTTQSGCELSGAWKSDSGVVIYDNSAEFRVSVTSAAALLDFLPRVACSFGQQCIYAKESSPNARLVYAV